MSKVKSFVKKILCGVYVNRDDPSILVPKRFGIGYTLNFGNRWAWVTLALLPSGARSSCSSWL